MNSKERVKKAFAHEEADRVPIFELTIDIRRPPTCWVGRTYAGSGARREG